MSANSLLVLDVGNTNTVLGLYRGDVLVDSWRVATNPASTTDETGVLYISLFAARGIDPAEVGAAIVSCVVPNTVHAISRACSRYFGVDAQFVGTDIESGMMVNYANPREVGADRIVNAVAAYQRFQSACVIVDFGTATTFDVVSAQGVYEGGIIAPGLGISLEALFDRAAKLPRVKIQRPETLIGKTTVASMQAGIVYGYVGLVDGICERILNELKESGDAPIAVVATGGLAGLIANDSSYIEHVERFLTLSGLRLIYERWRCETGS
jgi:type III pantothenate kinase